MKKFPEEWITEFNKFFEVEWNQNLPELIIMDDEKVADAIYKNQFERERLNWQVGWICNSEKVYVLDKKYCEHVKSDKDYLNLIKDCNEKKQNTLVNIPTGMGKTVALFYAMLSGKSLYTVPIRAL